MELQGEHGSKFKLPLSTQTATTFGRRNGFQSKDPTVSRRHVTFHLSSDSKSPPWTTISFQVIGKNPIWVKRHDEEDDESPIRIFKRFERGELGVGDMVCVNGRDNPIWFAVKRGLEESEESGVEYFRERLEDDSGIEFGFLVIGHEFDSYCKRMIYDLKNFNWFLDDPKEDVGDEDASENEKKGSRSKRKKAKRKRDQADDEEWISERRDDELISKAEKVQRPNYHTRSKDYYKTHEGSGVGEGSITKNSTSLSTAEEDEDDETLGGFIVDADEVEDAERTDVDGKDEEEDFVDDDE